MSMGKFITIEGTEGAGKSTVMNYIRELFAATAYDVIFTREPGGTALAEEIRKVMLFPESNEVMCSETELLLAFAGRAQHLNHTVLPALNAGKWVVSDRFVDASYAYQGGGRGVAMQHIQLLDNMIVDKHYPDLTILLDVPVEIGLMRTEQRVSLKDRIEQEKVDFFMRVRNVYLERAKKDPVRMKVINASQPLTDVQTHIRQILDAFMAEHSS